MNSPFGIALVGNDLFVADTDALLRFPYAPGETHVTAPPSRVVDLPAGTINPSLDEETRCAPVCGSNERDELGSDLVPDYMTAVRDGAFYGWPYSYYGQHVDDRAKPQNPDLVARAVVPDYALGPHTASLGLCAAEGQNLGSRFEHGMFVGQHGSWNRVPRSGYRVIFVPFDKGRPAGAPVDVLGGFVSEKGDALGRPVGVAIDRGGALLVADDVGNAVWRVTGAKDGEKLGAR